VKTLLKLAVISVLLLTSFVTYLISFNRDLLLASSLASAISFWTAVALLIPRKFYDMAFTQVKKGKRYWASFLAYLIFHILLYGIFYVMVLGYVGFVPRFGFGLSAAVPPPTPYFVYWESTSPGFWVTIGYYESDTVPFTAFIGVLLAMLLGANVEKVFQLYGLIRDTKRASTTLVAVPAIAIFSGTSCCLSLPSILIYLTALSVGAVSSVLGVLASPVYFAFAFYGLPIASLALLTVNLRDMNRMIWRLERLSQKKGLRLT